MEITNTQIPPLHSRSARAVGRTVSGAISAVAHLASKTVGAWVATPKALKLPIEAAALLYAPPHWNRAKEIAGAAILTETPKALAAFLSNQPIKYFGERWQLIGSTFPEDPRAPLTELDKKIGKFERAHPPLISSLTPQKITDFSLLFSPPPEPVHDMEKITNRHLEILIEKASYFSILKSMHWIANVPEAETTTLFTLLDEASRPHRPSLWKLFTNHYGSEISWWGRFKAGVLYLFLWKWIPIIPKTVDAYLKNMLTELRVQLKQNGEKRKKFINGLLEDADNFFEVYNGATETYLNDQARKGNLNHYRKTAVDLMFPKGEPNPFKTSEELRMDLARKLSSSFVDHFSPKVRFGFLEGWLNHFINKILRDRILPEVFLNVSNEGKEVMQRHNIPFFLALTKTLTVQVSKLQAKLEQDASDPSSLSGIKNFESIVKKFLWAIDMSDCKTVEEVRAKIELLKLPETGIDADVRNGIQLGIQKGLAVLFEYLAKQENTEELFANLFESLTYPLSGNLPMNDKQWTEMAIEYEGAKILLKQAGSALSKQIVQEAVQDKVRGGSIPEATERAAQKIFSEHQTRGLETFEDLLRSCNTIREKITQAKGFSTDETSIHIELGTIAAALKAYENKERVKITMEQDPPPEIAMLPHAEQEAILRVLYPLYEGANQVMDLVLHLQNLQKRFTLDAKFSRELRYIKEVIEEIAANGSPALSQDRIDRIYNHFEKIHALSPTAAGRLWPLKEQIHSIREMLRQIRNDQASLDALASLQPFPGAPSKKLGLLDLLLLSAQGKPTPGFKKWKGIEQIKEQVKNGSFEPDEQQKIFELIDAIGKYDSLADPKPDFQLEIWDPLSQILNEQKTVLERNQKRMAALLEKAVPRVHLSCTQEEEKAHRMSEKIWEEMDEKAAQLQRDVLRLRKLIERSKKEILLHPTASQLGQIGGTLGFLLGLATGHYLKSPESGAVIGAIAASSVAGLGSLAKRKWIKFSLPVIGAGTAAGFASHFVAKELSDRFSSMPHLPLLMSAAGASAGMEYVGAKMTKRLIDTGVDIAMPKVTAIFDKAYEHLLTSDIVFNGGLKIVMKQVVDLFPPKK